MAYLNHAAVIFASLVCLFDSGSARFVAGRCKKPTAVYVNEDNFGGQWFEQKKYDTLREIGDICNFIQVSLVENESGKQLKLNRTGYDNNKDSYRSKTQYAKHPNETQGAFIFDVGLLNYMTRKNPNFYVIHLENKFAITYSCVKSGVLKFEQIWILSRDQLPRRRSREMKRLEKIKSDLGINLPLYDERQRYCHPVEIAIDPIKILGDFWEKVYKAESKCAFPC